MERGVSDVLHRRLLLLMQCCFSVELGSLIFDFAFCLACGLPCFSLLSEGIVTPTWKNNSIIDADALSKRGGWRGLALCTS
eukprot:scaffold18707_cov80-Skeletonema_dohrnii-CCMP3373.AAC.4